MSVTPIFDIRFDELIIALCIVLIIIGIISICSALISFAVSIKETTGAYFVVSSQIYIYQNYVVMFFLVGNYFQLLSHLAEGHESLCHGAASVVHRPLYIVRPSGVNFFL